MPEFQFTPILTVVTNDQGALIDFSWDWADSGQGQWNGVTMEHEPTAAHESVCEGLDKWPKRWTPENMDGPASPLGDQLHQPITPVVELVETIEKIARTQQDAADAEARKQVPDHPGRVIGSAPHATVLRSISDEIRKLHGLPERKSEYATNTEEVAE